MKTYFSMEMKSDILLFFCMLVFLLFRYFFHAHILNVLYVDTFNH